MWMKRSGDQTVNNAHLRKRIAVWTRIAEEAAQLTKFFDDKIVNFLPLFFIQYLTLN